MRGTADAAYSGSLVLEALGIDPTILLIILIVVVVILYLFLRSRLRRRAARLPGPSVDPTKREHDAALPPQPPRHGTRPPAGA